MLLRRLEAYGFKSFADKTEIEFGPGITIVVGPNGSGKSNISDAIRWVLGEQSVRNLRGTKMEDVIFAGSAGRKPLGIAEVSLTFDNTDGTLPLDFNEVIITRRVFRSGDSEYYINKSLCRLKDIYELLADTGLGRDAMCVIGQNKVDEVLNSKPEDRRLLFEESAGITKYKQRKKDALRKLEDTTQNLIRVSDITNEIEGQLAPLAESAKRTTKYNTLHSDFVACQVTLLLHMLEKSEKMVESALLQKNHLTEQEVKISSDSSIKETEKIKVTTQLEQINEELSTYAAAITKTDTELERTHGKIAVLEERMAQGQRSNDRIGSERLRIEQQKSELEGKITSIQEMAVTKESLLTQLNLELASNNESYQSIVANIEVAQQQLEENQEKTLDYLHELVGERNKITTIEKDLARIKARTTTFHQEYEGYEKQLQENQTAYQELLAEQQTVKGIEQELAREQTAFLLAKHTKEAELGKITQQEKQLATQIHELKSRTKILSNMQNEFEGFARGIKSVLKSTASWHSGICGAVAQVLTVPDQYVTAVEIALGGALQHIITENAETAKQAMSFLKSNNLGRATFLPLDTIKVLRPREGEIAGAKAPGSLGFAADLVSCEPRYRLVIDALLGRTIIAENIDIALKIAKQQGYSLKIVTLDGELLNPGGSMTGGSTNKRDSSFLSRSNTIETMKQTIEELSATLQQVQEEVADFKTQLISLEEELKTIQQKRQQTEVRQAEIAVHAEKMQEGNQRLTLTLETISAEQKNCKEEERQFLETLAQVRKHITLLENRDNEHEESIRIWQQQSKELHSNKETLQVTITELKIKLTAIQQEISSIKDNIHQYEEALHLLQGQLQRLHSESNELVLQIQAANQELLSTKELQDSLAVEKVNYEELSKAQYTLKLNVLSISQQLDKELKELRRKYSDVQNRLHESELLATKYTYEVNHAWEKLEQQFSLTLEEAKKLCRGESIEYLSKLVKELDAEIQALGPVNHAAVAEYTSLQTRYDFLQTQSQDLIAAQEYLSSIIADMDKTMAAKFSAAFAKINEHFSDIFVRLFGGGTAQLTLMDPDNMLTTGIEIVVQPPGKKLQNLVLLSGGERTLTVIALLFAFLTYRPTPLIVVDEIDASLDEANVNRLSEFLRDYAQHTQFIVVTHRKGTMEVGTVIYGVTMEQSGISRLVSVKLMEKTG